MLVSPHCRITLHWEKTHGWKLYDIQIVLSRVVKDIDTALNRVKHARNAFVIAMGVYIKELTEKALDVAKKIVKVIWVAADCKEPLTIEYNHKAINKGNLGKTRKSARCLPCKKRTINKTSKSK